MPTMTRMDTWAAGERYEPYVGRWSRLVARNFLDWLALPAGIDWLDVGCGTGALSRTIVEHASPRSVHGIDRSAEFIEYARANSGKLSFASGGAGGINHMAGELFNLSAKVKLTHVPYKGAGAATTGVITNETDMVIAAAPSIT